MPIIHPAKRAEALATAIRNDPIAAGQIKEFLSADELTRVFGFPSKQEIADTKEELEDALAKIEELEEELKEFRD